MILKTFFHLTTKKVCKTLKLPIIQDVQITLQVRHDKILTSDKNLSSHYHRTLVLFIATPSISMGLTRSSMLISCPTLRRYNQSIGCEKLTMLLTLLFLPIVVR